MKKTKIIFLCGLLGLALTSCTVSKTYKVTTNPIGTKVGVAKLGLFGGKDCSIKTAAEKGGITKIGAVEFTTKVFIFPVIKTKVMGE